MFPREAPRCPGKGREREREEEKEREREGEERARAHAPTAAKNGSRYPEREVDGEVLHGSLIDRLPVKAITGHQGDPPYWTLDQRQFDRFVALYPQLDADDVRLEVTKAVAWLEANDDRRPTATQAKRWLTNWLNRSLNDQREHAHG